MKEPFVVSTADLLAQAKLISDMEVQSYISGLDSSQAASTVNGNVNDAINKVFSVKDSTYADTMNQLTGADNSITSAAYYLARSQDLTDAVNDLDDANLTQLNATQINAGLNERQKEINEWSNLNKLDTLYFMQVLFISLSLTGFLAFLSTNGSISPSIFTFVSYIIGFLAVIVLFLRWRYTNVSRDARYWHKSRFPRQDVQKTSDTKCKKGWLW